MELLRIRDILVFRDPDGVLARGLREAARKAEAFSNTENLPPELVPTALELAVLLEGESQ